MKKKIFYLVIGFLFVNAATHAQGKIGYVGTDEVFGAMPEVMKADSALAAYQQALSQSYQDQENELNAAYAKFTADSAALSPTMKEVRRKDLQDRITALQNREQELNKMLEVQKEKELKPIRDKMLKAIQDVAKENGYAHIFYKEQAVVFPEADDITAKVKKKLGIK